MISSRRNALQATLLCLPLLCSHSAFAQGGATKMVAFGTTATPLLPCPPNIPCVQMCGFPPPIDFLPADLVSLTANGAISAPHFARSVLAANGGVAPGLIFESAVNQKPNVFAPLTLAQVTLRFNYAAPFVFSTDIPGYDVTGADLGSVRVVTLTAEPGTLLLLGSPTRDAQGSPTFEAWNLELMNPTDPGIPSAFYSSTLTGQGFGAAQTPEPGRLALLGGLITLSGAAWRRKRKGCRG